MNDLARRLRSICEEAVTEIERLDPVKDDDEMLLLFNRARQSQELESLGVLSPAERRDTVNPMRASLHLPPLVEYMAQEPIVTGDMIDAGTRVLHAFSVGPPNTQVLEIYKAMWKERPC